MKNTRPFLITALSAVLFFSALAAQTPVATEPHVNLSGTSTTKNAITSAKPEDTPAVQVLITRAREDAKAQVTAVQEQIAALQRAYQNLLTQRNELAQQFLDAQLQIQLLTQQLQELQKKATLATTKP